MSDLGIGYTLGTERLFCPFPDFQAFCEDLLGRPIFTHEFARETTWAELRRKFEEREAGELECLSGPIYRGTP
jgi:hypothetical protein